MALNINDIYTFVNFTSNKYQSGQVTDDNFNTACAFVSLELFRKYSGLPEEYQPNNPTPRIGWQMTNAISDDLRPFIVNAVIPKNNSGYFPFPADYSVFSSMWYKYTLNNPNGGQPSSDIRWIENVSDGELRLRLTSTIKNPSTFFPVCAWYSYGFKVYPEAINRIELTYLKVPTTPYRNYTQLANDETVYDPDPTRSIQFEFPQTMYPNIATRIALYYGINIREDEFVNWMGQKQVAGN